MAGMSLSVYCECKVVMESTDLKQKMKIAFTSEQLLLEVMIMYIDGYSIGIMVNVINS